MRFPERQYSELEDPALGLPRRGVRH